MKANNSKPKIDLAPPKKESKRKSKREPRNAQANKEFKSYKPGQVIFRKVEEIKKTEKSVRAKYKEKQKQVFGVVRDVQNEVEMQPAEDLGKSNYGKLPDDIRTDVSKKEEEKEWKDEGGEWNQINPKTPSKASEPDELKLDERDEKFIGENFVGKLQEIMQANVGMNNFEDWRQGIADLTERFRENAQRDEAAIDRQSYGPWNTDRYLWHELKNFDANYENLYDTEGAFNQLIKFIADLKGIWNTAQTKQGQEKNNLMYDNFTGGCLGVLTAFAREIEDLKEKMQMVTASLTDFIEEILTRKLKTDQRVYHIERVMETWIKAEEQPNQEKKEIKASKRNEKIQQKKEMNIKSYKEKGNWIEEEEWKKMTRGQRVLKRWKFSDTHQVMDWRSWQSLSRKERDQFIVDKKKWWEAREKEINEQVGGDSRKKFEAMAKMRFFSRRYVWGNKTYNMSGYRVRNFRNQTRSKIGEQLKEINNTK